MVRYGFVLFCIFAGICRFVLQSHAYRNPCPSSHGPRASDSGSLPCAIHRLRASNVPAFPWGLCFVAAADYFLIFEKNDPMGFLLAWTPMAIYRCGIFLYCMARLCWCRKFHGRALHTSGLLFWILFSMICPPVAYLYMTLVDFFAKKQQKAFALGLFFLLLCDLCVVLSFLGLEVCRPLIWIFYVPALVLLTYADTSRSCIHDT